MRPIEKLGAFYLGKRYDLAKRKLLDDLVMYDARDLTTHAVCVGMTGSGKTGLCVDLLEEAALDGVPAIIVDPKGDMTNLLLTFPNLQAGDFEPWVNVDDARRKDMSVQEYAASTAETWRKGLADWGQGPERIGALKESADFRLYTPGSDAGLPISILASLQPPPLDDEEAFREQVQGTASALLGLAGIQADPLTSREHILLANIFDHFWRKGEGLDLGGIIGAIQDPPVRRLGVMDVDAFFPQKERFQLALALNGIIAAPGFQAWLAGEPLDAAALLYGPGGKPRHSILYIAHLTDQERMFFVTLLLEQVLAWVRRQSGTTSLRALLYFDEAFGFFPPVAEPPSKRPLLTLLKQARAFGLGVVLTTQNPVDLDYKGLSNAGTWFIGKLQTDQDKQRMLDGLESVSAEAGGELDRAYLDRAISDLDSRIFLLHNVHEPAPVIFHTRWAMSYLRGPLTRAQLRELSPARPEGDAPPPPVSGPAARAGGSEGYSPTAPSLPPELPQVSLPIHLSAAAAATAQDPSIASEGSLVYEASLVALGRVGFVDKKAGVDEVREVALLIPGEDLEGPSPWEEAGRLDLGPSDFEAAPAAGALFGQVPPGLNEASDLKALEKAFADRLYREEVLEIQHNSRLKLYGAPGEPERDFVARARQAARELRDQEVGDLRGKYEVKLDRLESKLDREEEELAEDRAEHEGRKREELLSAGESVIGVLGIFGRRSGSALSKAARKRRLTAKAGADVKQSEEEIERLKKEIEAMRGELEEEAADVAARWDAVADEAEVYRVKPRRADVQVDLVALGWAPYWRFGAGESAASVPAWAEPASPASAV